MTTHWALSNESGISAISTVVAGPDEVFLLLVLADFRHCASAFSE
jgi:hypothetical protein